MIVFPLVFAINLPGVWFDEKSTKGRKMVKIYETSKVIQDEVVFVSLPPQ